MFSLRKNPAKLLPNFGSQMHDDFSACIVAIFKFQVHVSGAKLHKQNVKFSSELDKWATNPVFPKRPGHLPADSKWFFRASANFRLDRKSRFVLIYEFCCVTNFIGGHLWFCILQFAFFIDCRCRYFPLKWSYETSAISKLQLNMPFDIMSLKRDFWILDTSIIKGWIGKSREVSFKASILKGK